MKLQELLEQVHDRESFFKFVRALIDDRSLNSGEWQNTTVETFLEASLAWAEDTDMGESQGLSKEPSWEAFAVFLYCGKIYE